MSLSPSEIVTLREMLTYHEDRSISRASSDQKNTSGYEARQRFHFHEDATHVIKKILKK